MVKETFSLMNESYAVKVCNKLCILWKSDELFKI